MTSLQVKRLLCLLMREGKPYFLLAVILTNRRAQGSHFGRANKSKKVRGSTFQKPHMIYVMDGSFEIPEKIPTLEQLYS